MRLRIFLIAAAIVGAFVLPDVIRGMIDEDITPQYGEDRVARRASA